MARLICIAVLLTLTAFLPGCGGCRHTSDADKTPEELEKELLERKKQEAERAKPDFQAKFLVSRPPTERPTMGCFAKPGHWTCVSLEEAKANHFNFVGELELATIDNEGNPLRIGDTPYELTVCRDMALPKGEAKSLESLLFIPPSSKNPPTVYRNPSTVYRFNAGQGGRHVVEFSPERLMGVMPSWQYHFVVLARTPESYQYLQKLDSIRPPSSLDNLAAPYYRVAMLQTDRRPALPSHANQWTGIACVLWDDASPGALDPAQQQAVLDWLHWGGQLIVSGPDTLDTLHDSFLAPHLPALSAGACKLGQTELRALNAFSRKAIRPLAPARAWSGVRLQKHPQAEFVQGAGELLAERRVGRGRIVVSAFRLSEREFTDWPGRDEVFNAMLLRHPARKYVVASDAQLQLQWADGVHRLDAGRVTALRYFARDAGVPFSSYGTDTVEARPDVSYSRSDDSVPAPGVAAWNDFSPVAQEARTILQNAARIEIPNRTFVIWVLAVYLVVLVPVNWVVFRGLGRVEWAWVAAPVIAVVCTGAVIRLAQLDIGFYRLQTEVAVAEIQGDYSRAHVARYNALYTSLTTHYTLQCDDPGAAVLPFPNVAEPGLFSMSFGDQARKLTCRRGDQVTLSGFPVDSNSTGLTHSEEMLDLGGEISLVENGDHTRSLVNRSVLNLHGVGLLRKTPLGTIEEAWIGEVPSQNASRGTSTSVPIGLPIHWNLFDTTDPARPLWASQREESPMSASKPQPGTLSLRNLLDLGQGIETLDVGKVRLVGQTLDVGKVRLVGQTLDVGEVRLIGWSNDNLWGLSIKPAAPQARRGIVVIAHLGYGLGDPPRPDENLRTIDTP